MSLRLFCLTTLLIAFAHGHASAVLPPGPPATNGGASENDGMKHAEISLSGGIVELHTANPPASPVVMTSGSGIDYTPDKFDVLEDNYFNAQHGWLSPGGFLTELPAGGSIWMKRLAATQPAGSTFEVFEGGNMAEGMGAWSMAPIYAADNDIWQWDGAMQHDYFTADMPGDYSMSFEVYVGDASGDAIDGFTAAQTTFDFTAVPEPSTCALALLGILGLFVRQR